MTRGTMEIRKAKKKQVEKKELPKNKRRRLKRQIKIYRQ
jgi:hypothetical protein